MPVPASQCERVPQWRGAVAAGAGADATFGRSRPVAAQAWRDAVVGAARRPGGCLWSTCPATRPGCSLRPVLLGTDGKLEVATFRYGSLLQGLRYLGYLWTGQHSRLSASDYGRLQARHIRIEADVPVRYQLDGDPGGLLPLSIEVLPNRLTLLAPPERVAALTGAPDESPSNRRTQPRTINSTVVASTNPRHQPR